MPFITQAYMESDCLFTTSTEQLWIFIPATLLSIRSLFIYLFIYWSPASQLLLIISLSHHRLVANILRTSTADLLWYLVCHIPVYLLINGTITEKLQVFWQWLNVEQNGRKFWATCFIHVGYLWPLTLQGNAGDIWCKFSTKSDL